MKGKLIVIEGIDGSGKATQAELLKEKLKRLRCKTVYIDFPQYETSFFGALTGRVLKGDFGDPAKLSPYLASLSYAFDRFSARDDIRDLLKMGYIVISNRYTSANEIHQGGKLKNPRKRDEFLSWLERLEFEELKIPRPDVVLYLDVPVSIVGGLIDSKKARAYLSGKKRDGHEGNKKHLTAAARTARVLARQRRDWVTIRCTENGGMLSKEVIAEKVWSVVKPLLK